jgi:protein TonB
MVVFEPFLEESRQRPGRGRGYVVSLALHAAVVALLIGWTWGRAESGAPPAPAPVKVAVSLRQPSLERPPERVGPEAPEALPVAERRKRAGSWPPAARRTRARPAPVRAIDPSPEPAAFSPLLLKDEAGAEVEGPEPGGGASEGLLASGPGGPGGPPGEGGELGSSSVRGRPIELVGRVVGGNRREMMGPRGLPYAPLKESTELRTYDFFPRLPASQWTGDRPYLVVVEVCVSGDGRVSDVALVRPASSTLDPVVLEAVRTWRYNPRLVDGQPAAFCHVVAIKYEPM